MNNKKSKQLYAKSVVNALGYLDDEFCTEAREFEPVSTETTFFNARKAVTAAAVVLLIVGACFFVPRLFGNDPIASIETVFHENDEISLNISYQTQGEGEYDVTFDGLLGVKSFCFRFDGVEGDYRVIANGVDVTDSVGTDGYYTVNLSDYPVGTGSVTVHLSGVENHLSEARISAKLPGSKTVTMLIS